MLAGSKHSNSRDTYIKFFFPCRIKVKELGEIKRKIGENGGKRTLLGILTVQRQHKYNERKFNFEECRALL
jgi:hypothetical protein